MKTANPWPRCTVQLTDPDDNILGVQSGHTLETDIAEVHIQPCKPAGRGGRVRVLGKGKIWSETFGILDVEDHVKKLGLIHQEVELRKEQEKAVERKRQEARERAKAKVVTKKNNPSEEQKRDPTPMWEALDKADSDNKSNRKDINDKMKKEGDIDLDVIVKPGGEVCKPVDER